MKCKYCNCCVKGWFPSKPNSYVCIGVQEPYIIHDINRECSEYKTSIKPSISSQDGFYIDFIVVKDDVKYNMKTLSMKEAADILANGLFVGIKDLWM